MTTNEIMKQPASVFLVWVEGRLENYKINGKCNNFPLRLDAAERLLKIAWLADTRGDQDGD